MGRISRETMLIKLAAVETKDKQAQSTLECIGTTRETTRRPGQTSQVVAQLSVIPFNREGIGFTFRNCIPAEVIPKAIVGIKSITVILFSLRSLIDNVLDNLLGAFPDHFPAQITACVPVYDREDVDFVFLSPIKVNNSSISASFTSSGTGAAGKRAA